MESVIGRAKRSVDSTVDAYLGRAAFAASVLGAIVFALAGVWIVLIDNYGTTVACFGLAAIMVLASLVVHATVVASERAAKRDIDSVERSIEKSGIGAASGFPFDLETVIAVLPVALPLFRTVRLALPYLIVAGLIASYIFSTARNREPQQEPAQL